MKRAGNLFPKIADPDNLRLAFLKASRGKKDRWEVVRFRENLDGNLIRLRIGLLNGSVALGRYRYFTVNDPKKRKICAALFTERVLHHAIMNVCEPALESYAIFDSYACRKGKGGVAAVMRARAFAGESQWYLKLDIRKYFDSIHHETLIRLVRRRIKDSRVIDLLVRILSTYETAPGRGLPIGNLVSQHMANFYLGHLDHWVKEVLSVRHYLRYMDDFVIFGESREGIKGKLGEIRAFLRDGLLLDLKENIQINRCAMGLPFLGYRVFPWHIRLSPRSRSRFSRMFRQYERNRMDGTWSDAVLQRHMEPLVAFTRLADADGFRLGIIAAHGVLS